MHIALLCKPSTVLLYYNNSGARAATIGTASAIMAPKIRHTAYVKHTFRRYPRLFCSVSWVAVVCRTQYFGASYSVSCTLLKCVKLGEHTRKFIVSVKQNISPVCFLRVFLTFAEAPEGFRGNSSNQNEVCSMHAGIVNLESRWRCTFRQLRALPKCSKKELG